METVYRDYSKKGVKFVYIYKSLAHPGMDGLVQPLSTEERLLHIKRAKGQLQTEIPWVADSMDNDVKRAFGNRNNSEFVVGRDGKLIHARTWSHPAQLRKDLAALVGKAEQQTTIADLQWPAPPRAESPTATGIVAGVAKPSGSVPLKYRPIESGDANKASPHYMKLRVEAQTGLISKGTGKIHLSFSPDPIHQVHWNNLAKPIHFEIKSAEGQLTPNTGDGPSVKVEADADPREFLVEARGLDTEKPITLEVRYFACHDTDKWCRAISKTYEILLERDRDAGTMRGGRGMGGGRPARGRGPNGSMWQRIPFFRVMDQNRDGTLSAKELEMAPDRLWSLDKNEDRNLSNAELRFPRTSFGGGGSPPRR